MESFGWEVIIAFSFSYFSIYFARWFGWNFRILDNIGIRLIPRTGGIGLILTFTLALFFGLSLEEYSILLLAFLVGFLDDVFQLEGQKKLFFIVVFSLIFLMFRFSEPVMLGWLIVAVVVIPAMMVSDGIDGLLATHTFLVLMVLLMYGNRSIMLLFMLGFLLMFFIFNAQPARIFLGDSGSMLLAFATWMVLVQTNNYWLVFALVMPIVDLVTVAVLRYVKGVSPFKEDRNHIHHILERKFGTHVAILIYSLPVLFYMTVFYSSVYLASLIALMCALVIEVVFR